MESLEINQNMERKTYVSLKKNSINQKMKNYSELKRKIIPLDKIQSMKQNNRDTFYHKAKLKDS